MKTSEIPFNVNITYDENLNEVPKDFKDLKRGVDFLKVQFSKLDQESPQAAVMLGQIGSYLRILNDFDESRQTFTHALSILSKHKLPHIKMAIILRMALIDLSEKKYSPANKIFEDSLKELDHHNSEKFEKLRDFALFHLGRSKFFEGSYSEAKRLITESLELRLIKGDLEMIEHTKNALGIINKKSEN